MDASLAASRLVEDLNVLLAEKDFEGAEEFLSSALNGPAPQKLIAHYQLGRIYIEWNKLSSAITHLEAAVDLAHETNERLFLIQIVSELDRAKNFQRRQRP